MTSTVTVTAAPSGAAKADSPAVATTTVYITATASGQPSIASPSANKQDLAVDGALADSEPTLSAGISSPDASSILRNSYILIALAAAAVFILLILLGITLIGNRGNRREYAPVREAPHVPVAIDQPYSSEASYSDKYPNPYSD